MASLYFIFRYARQQIYFVSIATASSFSHLETHRHTDSPATRETQIVGVLCWIHRLKPIGDRRRTPRILLNLVAWRSNRFELDVDITIEVNHH